MYTAAIQIKTTQVTTSLHRFVEEEALLWHKWEQHCTDHWTYEQT